MKDWGLTIYLTGFVLLLLWSTITQLIPSLYTPIVALRELLIASTAGIFYLRADRRVQNREALQVGLLFLFLPVLIGAVQFLLGRVNPNLLARGLVSYTELGFFFFAFAYADFGLHRRLLRVSSVAIILSSIGLMIDSHFRLFQFVQFDAVFIEQTQASALGRYRASFLLGGCTSASMTLAMMVGYIAYGLQSYRCKFWEAVLYYTSIAAGILGIFLTVSRVGMVGVSIVFVGLGLTLLRRRRFGFLAIAMVVVCSVGAYLLITDTILLERFISAGDFQTAQDNIGRAMTWREGIKSFLMHPDTFLFGNGLGTGKAKGISAEHWVHHESSILLVANEGGILILLTYLLPGMLWGYRLFRAPSLMVDLRTWNFIAYYAMAFVSPGFIYFGQLLYFGLFASFALLPSGHRAGERMQSRMNPRTPMHPTRRFPHPIVRPPHPSFNRRGRGML